MVHGIIGTQDPKVSRLLGCPVPLKPAKGCQALKLSLGAKQPRELGNRIGNKILWNFSSAKKLPIFGFSDLLRMSWFFPPQNSFLPPWKSNSISQPVLGVFKQGHAFHIWESVLMVSLLITLSLREVEPPHKIPITGQPGSIRHLMWIPPPSKHLG